jgi:hypothetical protein
MAKARDMAALACAVALTGCPLAMQDDFVVAGPGETTGVSAEASPSAPDGAAPSPGGCVARTCAAAGAKCGITSDGCGGILVCGICSGNRVCGAKKPNQCDKID